jgi:hypothetical protein
LDSATRGAVEAKERESDLPVNRLENVVKRKKKLETIILTKRPLLHRVDFVSVFSVVDALF